MNKKKILNKIVSDFISANFYLVGAGLFVGAMMEGTWRYFATFSYMVFVLWPLSYPFGTYTFLLMFLVYLIGRMEDFGGESRCEGGCDHGNWVWLD